LKGKNGANDLILFTGDSQAQTIEGQYEISGCILDFAKRHNVEIIMTIGGYRMESKEKPRVLAASANKNLLDRALAAHAVVSPVGSPIVGTAGLILGLGHLKGLDALCLLAETKGYLPDPKAAKSIIEVLKTLLSIDVDMSGLDEEIAKADSMVTRLQKIEEKRITEAEEVKKEQDKKVTYIS
jgi:proteasome assembly chaperone (PAC2) family protein